MTQPDWKLEYSTDYSALYMVRLAQYAKEHGHSSTPSADGEGIQIVERCTGWPDEVHTLRTMSELRDFLGY